MPAPPQSPLSPSRGPATTLALFSPRTKAKWGCFCKAGHWASRRQRPHKKSAPRRPDRAEVRKPGAVRSCQNSRPLFVTQTRRQATRPLPLDLRMPERYEETHGSKRGRRKGNKEKWYLLLGGRRRVTRHIRCVVTLPVCRSDIASIVGQRVARPLRNHAGRRDSVAAVAHGLRRQVTVVHALRAVLARRATVLVDTLGLAFAAADAGAAGSVGCSLAMG